jgi:hypothetical protein
MVSVTITLPARYGSPCRACIDRSPDVVNKKVSSETPVGLLSDHLLAPPFLDRYLTERLQSELRNELEPANVIFRFVDSLVVNVFVLRQVLKHPASSYDCFS